MNAPSARRRAATFRRIGWLVVAATAALALVGPAAGIARAASVEPIVHEGNVTDRDCPAGYAGIQVDPPATSGTAAGVTVSVTYGAGNSLGFAATGGSVHVAYVKGGDAYNEYSYLPDGVASDSDLVPPDNASGEPAGISHSVFCVAPAEPPPPAATADLVVLKWFDLDGDPTTGDDIVPGPGWEFQVEARGGTVAPSSGTTLLDDRGTEVPDDDYASAEFKVEVDGDGTEVDVSEILQVDYRFVEAFCYEAESEAERGTPGAGAVTGVEVNADELVVCEFFNTSGGQAGATATPKVTAPPTDTFPVAGGTPGDGWRFALLALTGTLGFLLLLAPAPARARRRR